MPFDPNLPFQPYSEAPTNPNQVAVDIEKKSALEQAQQADMERQAGVGHAIAPAFGSVVSGLIKGTTMGAVDPEEDNPSGLPTVPSAKAAGMAVSAIPSLQSLLGGGLLGKAAGSALQGGVNTAKAATSPLETLSKLAAFLKR